MYVAQIDFPFEGEDEEERVLDAAHSVMGAWWRQSQSLTESEPVVELPGRYRFFTNLYEVDSLDRKNDNAWQVRNLADLASAGGQEPEIRILGEDPSGPGVCDCSSPEALVLYAGRYPFSCSPVSCLSCFGDVPLYRIPTWEGEEHFLLRCWEADYRAIDTLNMSADVGERFAERQLLDWESRLSTVSRELAAKVGEVTGVPTYIQLLRMRGRGWKVESKQGCPSCGGGWLLAQRLHFIWDFRCDACRILSNLSGEARQQRPLQD